MLDRLFAPFDLEVLELRAKRLGHGYKISGVVYLPLLGVVYAKMRRGIAPAIGDGLRNRAEGLPNPVAEAVWERLAPIERPG